MEGAVAAQSSDTLSVSKAKVQSDNIYIPPDTYFNDQPFFYNGYGERSHVVTRNERSILSDLKIYPFPDDIKTMADAIYNKMHYQVRRGRIRNQLIFYCVYCAHLELGINADPFQIGSYFELSPGDVQKCDSLFSPLQTGYKAPNISASPSHYLPDYCRQMNLSEETIDEIRSLAVNILRKDPTLSQESPKTVAAGLLRYFAVMNGISFDNNKFSDVTGRSHVTIEQMHRRISIVDNS